MYQIQYNGKTCQELGIVVKERPNIPAPEYDSETYTIPGRDGDLYQTQDTIRDITISIVMGYVCHPSEWQERFRLARKWLLDRSDMRLYLDDDPGYYYRVKKVTVGSSAREVREFGEFTADFVCAGYQYAKLGDRVITAEEAEENPFDICHPDYIITGSGDCTLTVNEKTVTALVNGNLTINTDLMLAYQEDGTPKNTSITGEYEDLYLQPGHNTIKITSGFNLKVIPHWRSL